MWIRPFLSAIAVLSLAVPCAILHAGESGEYALAAAFQRIASQTRLDFYRGILRGPRGTLTAGSGSSADRALALATVLRESTPAAAVRFASCQLDAERADELMRQTFTTSMLRPIILMEMAEYLESITDPATRNLIAEAGMRWRRQVVRLKAASAQLTSIAREQEFRPTTVDRTWEAARESVRQHYWVQVSLDGRWLDLDPSTAAVGKVRCVANNTLMQLPEQLYHRVRVTLSKETRQASALVEDTLLDVEQRVVDLRDQSMTLVFAEDVGLWAAGPEAATSGLRTHTPVLILAAGVQRVGRAIQAATTPRDNGLQSALGAIGSALGSLPTGNDPPRAAQAKNPELTALTLRITLTLPGGKQMLAERRLFDRIGFAERSRIDASPSAGSTSHAAELEHALGSVFSIAASSGAIPTPRGGSGAAREAELLELFDLLGTAQGSYALVRRALLEQLIDTKAARPVLAHAVVSVLRWAPSAGNQVAVTMDLLHDPFWLSRISAHGAHADAAALGVSNVVAETIVAESVLDTNSAATQRSAASTSMLDSLDPTNSTAWRVLRTGGAALPRTVSPTARARLREHLSAGRAVLIPDRALRTARGPWFGWWTIDEQRRAFVDELETGGHASELTEEAIALDNALKTKPAVQRFSGALVCRYLIAIAYSGALLWAHSTADPAAIKGMQDVYGRALREQYERNKKVAEAQDWAKKCRGR